MALVMCGVVENFSFFGDKKMVLGFRRPSCCSLSRPRQMVSFNDLFGGFEDLFSDFPLVEQTQRFDVDVQENNDEIFINADMPGIKKDDLSVVLEDGLLTISGDRTESKEEKSETYYRQERATGKFSRSFRVGEVDEKSISAKLENGVLNIVLKRKEETKPRQITIS
jgi:HSP20 family protein